LNIGDVPQDSPLTTRLMSNMERARSNHTSINQTSGEKGHPVLAGWQARFQTDFYYAFYKYKNITPVYLVNLFRF
jgi:hypothetical protein